MQPSSQMPSTSLSQTHSHSPSQTPSHSVNAARTALRNGGCVVFPTDTAYGIGCDFRNTNAINRIMAVKGRTDQKFTLVAASLEQVEQFFPLSPVARMLAKQHWPGPLSIVVSDRFSIRVPDEPIARQLAEGVGAPLLATSANKSGNPTLYDVSAIKKELGEDAVDVWIDIGPLPQRLPSTIVRVDDGHVTIIRQGLVRIAS